jgi:hypothetical protein
MKRIRLVALLAALTLLLSVFLPSLAHEGREVGEGADTVLITFGWRVEPAYTDLLNGPELFIENHDTEAPVEGLEESLQLEVSYGGQSKVLNLRAVWNEPGHYTADLIPTQPGDYSFRVTGTIGSVEVDELFDSADGEFSSVNPISDIQFP